ncbi:MAG: amidophosphoribosyltransferase [Bdellovibrionales bacterium]|nr:amidophosphoribosyltransferase [Bdellovibrionales bacterium]
MCGIVGVVGHPEASNLSYLGLYALQHRGQESAGIVSTDGDRLFKIRKKTLVVDAFTNDSFKFLKGSSAIGHVRYSTTGQNALKNVQPMIATGGFGNVAVAHNGNITNFRDLKQIMEDQGALFQSTADTEIILHLLAREPVSDLKDKISQTMAKLDGAFSLLFLTPNEMIAVRDPWGFRPLSLGRLENGGFAVASETCAFDLIGARFERDIEPGEILVIAHNGTLKSTRINRKASEAKCVFEHVYFSRPDSFVFGKSVYQSRKELGFQLAKEHPIKPDIVIPVPDSGVISAMGYAEAMNVPMQMGLIRNHYVGRTFIEPKQSIRGFGVKVKLNPVKSILEGKKVVIVDDSIVRGTTSQKIVKMVRDTGAKEIALLITSPPFLSPCVYGIDTPSKEELLASQFNVEQMREKIKADYLGFLSVEGMYKTLNFERSLFCDACFSGTYPTSVDLNSL